MPVPALFKNDEEIFAPCHLLGWLGFSLAAGCVNAGGFLACRNFVSHVTGMVTSMAVDLTRPPLALEFALVFAAFIAGAAVATLTAETSGPRRRAAFALPVLLSSAALAGVAVAGRVGAFGAFGAPTNEVAAPASFALLGALAAAMGSLNAAVALATSNAIRSTHLTGPATDLATNLVRAALLPGAAGSRELRWGLLRAAKVAAFVAGGVAAATVADRLKYDLFLAAALVLVAALGLTALPGALRAAPASARAEPAPSGAPPERLSA
jgi:hypothetical protein